MQQLESKELTTSNSIIDREQLLVDSKEASQLNVKDPFRNLQGQPFVEEAASPLNHEQMKQLNISDLHALSKASSYMRKKNYIRLDDLNRPVFERTSEVPPLPFGELKPDTVPVFGYPFVNYSPRLQNGKTDDEDQAKKTSDKLWQVFSKAIIFQANCADHAKDDKLLLAEMIDQREENMDVEENIMKALTYGHRLSNHGVDDATVESLHKFES